VPALYLKTNDELTVRRAILDVVERGKIIDGAAYPYSPSLAGADNKRALLGDATAAAALATTPRQWKPGDLEVVVQRSIRAMKADGWLVIEEIKGGPFRRAKGLRVDRQRAPLAGSQRHPVQRPYGSGRREDTRRNPGSRWSIGQFPGQWIDQLPQAGGRGWWWSIAPPLGGH
jgi:hypothetical protein